jgi:hypothetical protein
MGIPSKQTGPADGRAAFRRPFHGGAGRAPAEALRRCGSWTKWVRVTER